MSRRRNSGALFLAFAGLGGTAAVVPAVLPSMAGRHPAELSTYLQAVPATLAGLLLGVLASAYAISVLSARRTVFVGSLLQAAAVAGLITTTSAVGFVSGAAVAGLGFGLVEASGSVLARQQAGPKVVGLLAALTGTVAVVAAGCPLIVALVPWTGAPALALGFVAAIHLGTAACTVRGSERLGRPPGERVADPAARRSGRAGLGRLGGTAVALALYVGVEAVFSGWSAVIAADRLSVGPRQAALGTSVFWALMATGRLTAGLAFRSRTARPRHLVVTAAGAGGCLVIAGSGALGPGGVVAALCLAVVLLGPCYSMILGLGLAGVDAGRAERVTGILVACGAVGGVSIPFLVLVAGQTSADRFLFVGCALLLLITAALVRISGRPAAR